MYVPTPMTTLSTSATDLSSAGVVLMIIAMLVLFVAGGAIATLVSVLRLAVGAVLAPLFTWVGYFGGAVLILVLLSPALFSR